jgi:signal transduction histidine kinase
MTDETDKLLDLLSPFHLQMDCNDIVTRIGPALSMHTMNNAVGQRFFELFDIVRPFSGIRAADIGGRIVIADLRGAGLRLRGQLISVPGKQRAFVASPWVNDTNQLPAKALVMDQLAPHDPTGDYLVMLSAMKEQTEDLGRAINGLKRSEGRFRSLIENMSQGLLVVDGDRIESANPAARTLLGLDNAVPGSFSTYFRDLRGNNHNGDDEIVWNVLGPNDQAFLARGCVYEISTSDGCRNAVLFAESSAQENFVRMQREFITVVSHELRTPLTAVRASIALLGSEPMQQYPEKAREVLRIAERNARRLGSLIDDVIDIERLEHGALPLKITDFAVEELVATVLDQCAARAEKSGIEICVDFSAASSVGDFDRLTQVIVNLVTNAITHSPTGGTISLTANNEGQAIVFRVIDQGPGIKTDDRARVFDRFFQAEPSTTRKSQGAGLGLAICKGIVEQHLGTIGLDAYDANTGASFWIRLPREQAE